MAPTLPMRRSPTVHALLGRQGHRSAPFSAVQRRSHRSRHRCARPAFSGDFLLAVPVKKEKNPAPQAPARGREESGREKEGKGGKRKVQMTSGDLSGALHGLQTLWQANKKTYTDRNGTNLQLFRMRKLAFSHTGPYAPKALLPPEDRKSVV